MRYYEAIFIVHPNQEDAGLTKVVEATKKALVKRGGELVFEENMGKKRLAYAVEKQRFGTYILLQFQGDGVDIGKFGQDLELNDDVIAQLIVTIDPDEIRTSPPASEERGGAETSDAEAKQATKTSKKDEGADKPAEKEPEASAEESETADEPAAKTAEENGGAEAAAEPSESDEVAEVDAEADSPV